jgi:hypothetical protein
MSYKGDSHNGVVVLPPESNLADGTTVEAIPEELQPAEDLFLAAVQKVTKPRPYWPKDYTQNLDHYLHGFPNLHNS